MAKKTENKLDDDFDFGAEFGDDNFDFDLPDPTVKDDRKPSVKIASGIKEGISETLRSREFAISSAKKLFPTGYGQAYDEADRIGQTFKNLYDESAQAIRPAIKQAKQIATRLIPSDSKYLPSGLQKVFKSWEAEAASETGAPGNVEGNNREALLSSSLKDLFKAEALEKHRDRVQDKAEGDLQRGVSSIRHKSILETLNRTAMAVTSLDNYNTKITVNYQKQSLTLQYRQLFALEDMRSDAAKDSLKRDQILLAIAKNTALPEYTKIRDSEARKQAIKNRFYDSIASGLYGGRNQYIEKTLAGIKKNVGNAIKQGAQGFMSGLTQLSMMIDMADGSGMDTAQLAGNVIGSTGTEAFGHALAGRLGRKLVGSKLDKRWGISDKAHKLSAGVDSLPNYLNEFRKTSKYSWGNSLKDKGLSLLQTLLPSMAPDTQTDIARGGDMNSPFHFTKRTDRSLNEVIPGYLSRILREVQVLRTGNSKIPLIEYDHDKNGFARGDSVTKSIFAKTIPAAAVQATQMRLNGIMAMIDPKKQLSPEAHAAIRKRLLFNSADNNMASRERLADEDAYSGASAAAAKEATDHMTDYFNWAGAERIKDFQVAHNSLSRDIADPRQHIQQQIDLGHLQRLSRMGLVDASTGRIDLSKILNHYLDEKNGLLEASRPTPPSDLTENLKDGPDGPFVGPRKGAIRQAKDRIRELYEDREEVIRQSKRKAKRASIKSRRIVRDAGLFVKDQAVEAGGKIREDLYAATEDHPRLRAVLVDSEQYLQKTTGKVVQGFDDLTDDIVDKTTQKVVITKEELAKIGVLDPKTGRLKPVTDLSGAVVKAARGAKITKETFSKNGVKKLAKDVAQTFTQELLGNPDTPTDIIVEGEEQPRITMAEMKEGECVDVDTNTPILKPSDITGAVKNKLGQLVIRTEDLPKLRFFNVRIAKYSPLWFAGRLITKALRWQLIGAPKMAARNLRRLGSVFYGAGKVVVKSALWMAGFRPGRQAEDLYLPGAVNPIIIGRIMAEGGYWSVITKRPVLRPMDIDGELRDKNGQVVITAEQYKAGLYNIHGRKLTRSLASKLIKAAIALPFKVAGKVVGLPFKAGLGAAKLAARGTGTILKGLGKGIAGTAGGLARGAGWLAGIRYEGNEEERQALYEKRKNSSGKRIDLVDPEQAPDFVGPPKPPTTIKDLANNTKERMGRTARRLARKAGLQPGERFDLVDPVDQKLPTANLDKLEAKDTGKFKEIQRKTGMGREEAERVHELKDMDAMAEEAKEEMAERKDKKHRVGSYEDHLDKLKDLKDKAKGLATAEGIKGLVQKAKDKAKDVKDGWSARDIIDGAEDAKDAAKGAWKGVKKGGSWLAKNAKRLWNMRKGLGAAAAGAEGLSAVAGTAGAAEAAVGGATALEGAVAGGAVAAEGTAAVAAGGGLLATLGGAALSVISAPVVISALAAGLIGYGLYRGYKYYRKGHLSELGQLRCVQYGFRADDASHARSIIEFEGMMTPLVKVGPGGQLVLDDQKISLKDCLKNFDLNPGDPLQVRSFLAWYNNRFKPVFLTHQSALRGLTGKGELGEADDLKADQKKKYLDAVSFASGPYTVAILPVADLQGSHATNANDVARAVQAAQAALGKPGQLAAAATAAAGAVTGATAANAAAAPKPTPANPQTAKQVAEAMKTSVSIDRLTPLAASNDAEMPVKKDAGVPAIPQTGGSAGGLVLASGDMVDGRNANAFVRLGRNVKLDGMNPQMKTQLLGLIEEYGNLTGKATTINDGVRTFEEQAALKRKYGARAAEPGTSMHEYGLAVDINQATLNEMDKLGLLRKYGFIRPVGQEPWHMEPIGIQANLDLYKKDQGAAAQAVLSGAGKGGGGWGTQREAIASSRNLNLAKTIMDASVTETDPKQVADNKVTGGFSAPITQPAIAFGSRTKMADSDAIPAVTSIKTAAWHADATQNAQIGATRTALASANDAEFQVRKSSQPLSAVSNTAGDDTVKIPDPTGPGLAGVKDTVLAAAKMVGTDGNLMLQMAAIESDFRPNAAAGNTSAQGLWQDTQGTWADLIKKYGSKYGYTLQNTSPTDVKAAAILNAHFLKDNLEALGRKVNRPVNAADAYAMHFLGKTGGERFLDAMAQNPDASAAQLFPEDALKNRNIFYSGNRALSLTEVYGNFSELVRKKSQAYGLSTGQITTASVPKTPTGPVSGALIGVQPSDQPRPPAPVAMAPMSTRGRPSPDAPAVIGAGTAPMLQPPGSYLPPSYAAPPQVAQAPQPQHVLDNKIFVKSENLLGQQLEVQTEIRDILLSIKAQISNKDGDQKASTDSAKTPDNRQASVETYTPPQGRVSMTRQRWG